MRYSFIKDIDHNHQPHIPLLVTDHLYLEKINKDHSDDWFMAMMDGYEDGAKWLNWSTHKPTKQEVEETTDKWLQEYASKYYRRFFIFEKETKQLIGLIGFYQDTKPNQVQLSYYMRKSSRNKGYMTEMVNAFVPWIQDTWDIPTVIIRSEKNNIASLSIMKKVV